MNTKVKSVLSHFNKQSQILSQKKKKKTITDNVVVNIQL